MDIEQVISIYTIIMNLAGLMVCLFQYIRRPTKAGVFALVYLLLTLLSNYYWGVYVVIMSGEYPNVSSFLSYIGWNLAYLLLAIMMVFFMNRDRIRYFNPLCLIPIPLNIVQLFIYLQYGGYFNNIWQVTLSTFVVCVCINNILRYIFKHKKIVNLRKPYIEAAVLYWIFMEYIAWTGSCFAWPTEWIDPYIWASVFGALIYILFPIAVIRTYFMGKAETDENRRRTQNVYKTIYIVFVSFTCVGGCLLAVWMRDTLNSGIGEIGDKDPFSIIAVMLFVVSIVILLFTSMIILIVSSDQKNYESRKLRIEKKDAEKSNAAKSEFLANMSHEIRTPINAVLGMNEMILRESLEARDMLPEEREEIVKIFSDICNYSGNIESAGNNLLSIINDILDFSKIEAGKMEITNGNYKLSSVLNDVSNMISFKAKSKGIEYIVDVDETLPDGLYGDEIRVRQIITNLLNNAVKYTQKGTIWLNVNERKGEDDKVTNLIVKVKDTGIGIKKEDISKLFKKFERVDMQNNSTVEGTGLGLAITGSLLDMMGGEISVESEYGKGSEFTVSIPQKIVSEEPIGNFREKFEKSISELKAPKENFHAPNAHILIVDDTVMNLTVAKGLLKKTRVMIDTAMSGEESIELAKEKAYDLILMDQRMPGMDGITAMHHIKDDGNGLNAGTPVICLTADAVSGAREKYLSEGFEDYITKPIDSRALLDALLNYLPKNKIKTVEAKQTEKPAEESVSDKEFSGKLINKKIGIKYCNGDEEFYETLLSEYVSESNEKANLIKETYDSKDWNNYGIHVHSLKSTSKMIGAEELSEMAASLEAAAGKEDTAAIDAGHEKMCILYEDVVNEIAEKFDIKVKDRNENEDIMEFMPE